MSGQCVGCGTDLGCRRCGDKCRDAIRIEELEHELDAVKHRFMFVLKGLPSDHLVIMDHLHDLEDHSEGDAKVFYQELTRALRHEFGLGKE